MIRTRRSVVGGLACVLAGGLLVTACSSSTGTSAAKGGSCSKVYTMKFDIQESLPGPQAQAAYRFQSDVQKSSAGCIKVTVYPGGVLGPTTGVDALLAANSAQLALQAAVSESSYVPTFNFFQVPMIFNDESQIAKGLQSQAVKDLENQFLQKSGIRILGWGSVGFVQLLNSVHPIVTPADLKGLKVRIIPGSVPQNNSFQALGATPVPIASNEEFTAEQSHLVNAAEDPPSVFKQYNDAQNLKYMTIMNFEYNPEAFMINNKLYESLSPALQADVNQAATDAAALQTSLTTSVNQTDIDGFVKDNGVKVTTLTDEQRKAFTDALSSYYKTAVKTYGTALFDAFGIKY